MDKDGQKEPVPLTKARFDRLVTELAGCAEPAVKPSVSIPNANRLGLNTQKNKVVSVAVAAQGVFYAARFKRLHAVFFFIKPFGMNAGGLCT